MDDKERMQENLEGRHHCGDLGMDGRIILKCSMGLNIHPQLNTALLN
jgi:hypothetical protein